MQAALAGKLDEAVPASVQLAAFVCRHRRLFVITGAGVSTDSGIPDYRDALGKWKRSQPVTFQAFVSSAATRRRYWARSLIGWPHVAAARPGAAHSALAALQAQGRVHALVTQNVDGLHQAAGSTNVEDLHGRIDRIVCLDCSDVTPRARFQQRLQHLNPDWQDLQAGHAPDGDADLENISFDAFRVPACERCGGMLKPDVVFFGENVPRPRVARCFEQLTGADAVLAVGSSLMVYSGFRFVRAGAQAGLPVAILNLGRTRADDLADLKLAQPCGLVMQGLLEQLSPEVNPGGVRAGRGQPEAL